MQKIQRVSGWFKVIFQIIFYILPLFNIFEIFLFNSSNTTFTYKGITGSVRYIPYSLHDIVVASFHLLPFQIKMMITILNFIPTLCLMYGVYALIKLFRNYQQTIIFSLQNVKLLYQLAYAFIAMLISKIVSQFLVNYITSLYTNPNKLMIGIGISSEDVLILLMGLLLLLLSWIMAEGFRLQEDQNYTV